MSSFLFFSQHNILAKDQRKLLNIAVLDIFHVSRYVRVCENGKHISDSIQVKAFHNISFAANTEPLSISHLSHFFNPYLFFCYIRHYIKHSSYEHFSLLSTVFFSSFSFKTLHNSRKKHFPNPLPSEMG